MRHLTNLSTAKSLRESGKRDDRDSRYPRMGVCGPSSICGGASPPVHRKIHGCQSLGILGDVGWSDEGRGSYVHCGGWNFRRLGCKTTSKSVSSKVRFNFQQRFSPTIVLSLT